MATIHPEATIKPGKTELITAWLPTRSWYSGPAEPWVTRVGSYRFDDPAGEVGIETMLVRAEEDGPVYQVPMTYRAGELAGGRLITTMAHSVLGERFVYDALTDPVYVAELVRAIVAGGTEVAQIVQGREHDGVSFPSGVKVRGSGSASSPVPAVSVGSSRLVVPPVVPATAPAAALGTLEGTWSDGAGTLAWLLPE